MPNGDTFALAVSGEYQAAVDKFREDWYEFHKRISHEETPAIDGDGNPIIKKRPDGYDYIVDAWMTDRLNKYFPGWSTEKAGELHFHGAEWITAQIHLIVYDTGLLRSGVPFEHCRRTFYASDSVRIQYAKGQPHTPENLVDLGDNVKSAITAAKKWAINRLLGIGDDVYGKRIEEEGAGSLETVLETRGDATTFGKLIEQHKIPYSEVFKILGVKGLSEVTDFTEAWGRIKGAKGL